MPPTAHEKNYYSVERLSDTHIRQLHGLYQNEWWTGGRTLDDVRKMLRHSDFVFAICESPGDNLVGFARVLTDRVFKALILDVIVHPDARDQGLGKSLIERILGHPELTDVQHFELYCLPEMTPYYRQWGFEDVGERIRLMRLERGNR